MADETTGSLANSRIEGITTHWSVVKNTSHFTLRYAPAIRKYIASMATNSSDVEDILQDFLFRVVKHGFRRERIDEGKFRYYLKAAIRNTVRSHYRRCKTDAGDAAFSDMPARESGTSDDPWLVQWRECLLDRTWRALERYQSDSTSSLAYTVLKLSMEFPDETSAQLSTRAAKVAASRVSPESFRQQLHRARKKFAELLIDEVAATLERSSDSDIEAELIDLRLIDYVRGSLRMG